MANVIRAAPITEVVPITNLIRLGAYTQMEGSFYYYQKKGEYFFRLNTNQIDDMDELLLNTLGKTPYKRGPIAIFRSKELYEALQDLGFNKFHSYDWNVPNVINRSQEYKKEYLRAVFDSLGDINVRETSPIASIRSVNHDSLKRLSEIYGGNFFTTKDQNYSRSVLEWYGRNAMDLVRWLDWKFYCGSNARGAELIKIVKWSDF